MLMMKFNQSHFNGTEREPNSPKIVCINETSPFDTAAISYNTQSDYNVGWEREIDIPSLQPMSQ